MCGITGIITQHKNAPEKLKADVRLMTDALAHRGRDGEGVWVNDNTQVGFGHRRLKIIDLSNEAAQPMVYAGRYTITYNGEIYNYIELKNELLQKGYQFFSQGDTEIILAAYDCWKENCLQRFDGMFAFAIWDEQEQTMFAARDRFGEKPFYFFKDETRFLFASEMKALWAAGIEKPVNNTQLLNYITLGMVQNVSYPAETFFHHICQLEPAHYITFHLHSFNAETIRYWDLDKESINHSITQKQAIEQFSSLLQRAVETRMRSDVLAGTSLSGGLDSSAIVALSSIVNDGSNSHTTFSAIFPGFEKDESAYIKQVTEKFNLSGYHITPEALQLADDFDKLLYHQEEPFQSLSIYAQYKVYELAKQHGITVILDGQGADETMAGYHKYYNWYWQQLTATGHWAQANAEIHAAKKLNPNARLRWTVKNKLAAFMPEMTAHQLERKAKNEQKHHRFLNPEFYKEYYLGASITKPIVRKLNDMLYYNTAQLGLQELLRYADRNSMAHGREVRLPFLQHELVQFVFSLPAHFKIKEGWTKWILRKSMAERLPASIVWRKDKIGYEPPQQQWLQHKHMTEKIMESRKTLVKNKILTPQVLQQPIIAKAAHEAGNNDFRYLCAANLL